MTHQIRLEMPYPGRITADDVDVLFGALRSVPRLIDPAMSAEDGRVAVTAVVDAATDAEAHAVVYDALIGALAETRLGAVA